MAWHFKLAHYNGPYWNTSTNFLMSLLKYRKKKKGQLWDGQIWLGPFKLIHVVIQCFERQGL